MFPITKTTYAATSISFNKEGEMVEISSLI